MGHLFAHEGNADERDGAGSQGLDRQQRVVTGTDTGIGKTVFSAGLAGLLDGFYWKPVQSGLDEETDSEVVARLSGLPDGRVLPEVYRLTMPLSPHRSAEIDGVAIEADDLSFPVLPTPLVIEGAGGLMVPLNRQTRFIDIFEQWRLPVILCARTALGTINHTLGAPWRWRRPCRHAASTYAAYVRRRCPRAHRACAFR
ncbi:MAG: dethiobiotin synthase [Mesorhizobium sp.]|nr:MAG: dethiobiotin synthase [Mesorhizobium sp.]